MPGRLSIGKLHAPCFVTGSSEAARTAADRAVRALRDHFPQTARQAFAPWLDRADDSIWIVRSIELAILTAADAPADALAASTVTALGHALGDALVGDGDGLNTIRFENRAAYLARFVTDAAWGDAWSRWYYAPFHGLKLLPASCAIRTALIEDPVIGRQALERLDAGAFARVASAFTPQDEALVLSSLAGIARENAEVAFSRAWGEYKRQLETTPSPSLFETFVRAPAEGAGATFLRALRHIRDAVEVLRHAASPDAAFASLAARTEIPREILRDILAQVTSPRREPATGTSATTPFAGLLLLLRELDNLPPLPRGPPLATKWLTLAMCAGRDRAEAVLYDEALRNLFGIPSVSLAEIARYLRATRPGADAYDAIASRRDGRWLSFDRRLGISPAWSASFALAAHRALRRFARRLPGFAGASAQYLWANFLASDALLEYEDHRVIVRYGRPPLHLMLTLTGMTRGLEAGQDALGRTIIVFTKD